MNKSLLILFSFFFLGTSTNNTNFNLDKYLQEKYPHIISSGELEEHHLMKISYDKKQTLYAVIDYNKDNNDSLHRTIRYHLEEELNTQCFPKDLIDEKNLTVEEIKQYRLSAKEICNKKEEMNKLYNEYHDREFARFIYDIGYIEHGDYTVIDIPMEYGLETLIDVYKNIPNILIVNNNEIMLDSYINLARTMRINTNNFFVENKNVMFLEKIKGKYIPLSINIKEEMIEIILDSKNISQFDFYKNINSGITINMKLLSDYSNEDILTVVNYLYNNKLTSYIKFDNFDDTTYFISNLDNAIILDENTVVNGNYVTNNTMYIKSQLDNSMNSIIKGFGFNSYLNLIRYALNDDRYNYYGMFVGGGTFWVDSPLFTDIYIEGDVNKNSLDEFYMKLNFNKLKNGLLAKTFDWQDLNYNIEGIKYTTELEFGYDYIHKDKVVYNLIFTLQNRPLNVVITNIIGRDGFIEVDYRFIYKEIIIDYQGGIAKYYYVKNGNELEQTNISNDLKKVAKLLSLLEYKYPTNVYEESRFFYNFNTFSIMNLSDIY